MLKDTACPMCGLNTVGWVTVDQVIQYGVQTDPDHAQLVVAGVPTGVCSACEFSFTDQRAEVLRDARVNQYLDELCRAAQRPSVDRG